MAEIPKPSIFEDDHLLIHRDGVDYKTPFSTLLSSIPEVDVSIPGVLTYQGIVASNAAEPTQTQGEIWLLKEEGDAAAWVPDGAKTGDYITWAEDSNGVESWHIVGNCAGVDFEEFATKEEVANAVSGLSDRIDEKASAADLEALDEKVDDLKSNGQVIASLVSQNGKAILKNEQALAEHEARIETLEGASSSQGEALDDLKDKVNKNTLGIAGNLAAIEGLTQGVETNNAAMEENKAAIEELQNEENFKFSPLPLLPAT